MRWYPYQDEIKYSLTPKEHEFYLRETQGLRVNVNIWKGKYLYTNILEAFFSKFPYLLYEWLKRKNATNYTFWPLEPVVWDLTTLDRMRTLFENTFIPTEDEHLL
jgi:hypothetical protein